MNQITIGTFHYTDDGYQGRIQALGLDAPLCLVPVDPREGEDAPAWRIHLGDSADGPPIGEARHRSGGAGGSHIALRIDGPLCPRPVEAMLLKARQGDVRHLVWSRPSEPDKDA